jgi:hypothetical protein
MIELLMLLFVPGEVNPQKLGIEYVQENLYVREDKEVGIFYKIDTKEYQVMLTYCKPVDKK